MRFVGPFSLDALQEREWVVTNGLGGYASATLCGMHTRRYHGLLVAALQPPGARTLLVAKLEETAVVDGNSYALATNEYPGMIAPDGYRFLEEVCWEANALIQRFRVGSTQLEKRIAMVQGENTTCVSYRNLGAQPINLRLDPLVNARDFHGDTAPHAIDFAVESTRWAGGPLVRVRPSWLPDGYVLYADDGTFTQAPTWYYNMLYAWECRRGLGWVDNHFAPGYFACSLAPGSAVTVTLSTLPPSPEPRNLPTAPAEHGTATAADPVEIHALRQTAVSYLVRRVSVGGQAVGGLTVIAGYHWFGDWGRDTMIALPGLCLSTGHYEAAAEILRTFALAQRRGLLPNLFLDSGAGEAYNTVDAALWYIHAVDAYLRATGDRALLAALRPALVEIISSYRTGTDFGIQMDSDGLIRASAPGWQLTWMDAKVGDWVVTPRAGKAVEINALWYNALRIMERFARDEGWEGDYGALADRVKASFAVFWYAEGGYLYDVVDDVPDASLRPNQILAVSLPHSPLPPAQARGVLDAVTRDLLTPYGLRSLSPRDPAYQGHYGGDVWHRDGAYHQGTVWGWLIGPYVDAYFRVHGESPEAKAACRELLQPLLAHTHDAGVGAISEIFEGDPPHHPVGTISQAWSVSEVIRVWDRCRGEH
jgi:predicted glycogen debranching enzyme